MTERYVLLEPRTLTPFYDALVRGEIDKFNHLTEDDKTNILAMARVVFSEGVAVGKATTSQQDIAGGFNF